MECVPPPWSGRLSHWARRSWSVTFPPILKHLWGVLLIFNPLKNTCSFIIDFFWLLSKYMVWIKAMRWERHSECKKYSAGKSVEPKVLYSVHLLNHPAKKKEQFSSSPTEATQLLLIWSYFMERWNPCSLLVLMLPHKSALFSIIFSQGSKALLAAHSREFVWGWRRRNTLNLSPGAVCFLVRLSGASQITSFLNLGSMQYMNLEKEFLKIMPYYTAWLFWPIFSQDAQQNKK